MPDKNSILVIGSSNTDMVIKTRKFPSPGETILGGEFFLFPGGKGANQAVAAARLGGDVTLITKIGQDLFGRQALEQFHKERINTRYIIKDAAHPSGVALITVDAQGENTIVVAPGANATLKPADISATKNIFSNAAIVLMQLEIPIDTVTELAAEAFSQEKKVILNPAPAIPLPPALYNSLYVITPNESEAETLTGIAISDVTSMENAAKTFRDLGVKNVIITLGERGAFLYGDQGGKMIPSEKVNAMDTTAAGDVFNGALAVALSEEKSLDDAVAFANRCAAVSVTRMGAQSSAPYRNEIDK